MKGKVMVVAVALALALGGVAWVFAQNGGVIHACVDAQGRVRIVENGADDCRVREEYRYWSVTGPPGPTGPEGVAPSGAVMFFDSTKLKPK